MCTISVLYHSKTHGILMFLKYKVIKSQCIYSSSEHRYTTCRNFHDISNTTVKWGLSQNAVNWIATSWQKFGYQYIKVNMNAVSYYIDYELLESVNDVKTYFSGPETAKLGIEIIASIWNLTATSHWHHCYLDVCLIHALLLLFGNPPVSS